jgi:hypothetical protein
LIFVLASGFGFGLISGTFAIVDVLRDLSGPGTIGIFGHSSAFFLTTGESLVTSVNVAGQTENID